MYFANLLILLTAGLTLAATGGYHDTCDGITYHNDDLCASSEVDFFLGSRNTWIDLNHCLGESNGYLIVGVTPSWPITAIASTDK